MRSLRSLISFLSTCLPETYIGSLYFPPIGLFSLDWIGYTSFGMGQEERVHNDATAYITFYTTTIYGGDPYADQAGAQQWPPALSADLPATARGHFIGRTGRGYAPADRTRPGQ